MADDEAGGPLLMGRLPNNNHCAWPCGDAALFDNFSLGSCRG